MQNPNITEDNIVDEITKEIKHYSKEPVYLLEYESYYCHVEVFVNNIPVFKQFSKPLTSSAFDISQAFLKNGKQKVTYKMYPVGKIEGQNEDFSTLKDISYLKFTLITDDKNASSGSMGNNIMEYKTPSTEVKISEGYSEQKFVGAGKTYYEGSFDINVDVPYNLNPPFENAQDLRKLDKKELESKLLKKYKEVWEIYQNKELDNIAKIEYNSFKDLFVAGYDSKEIIEENMKVFYDAYKSSSFEMQPIEKYKLEFFADGKMVALMLDTADNRFRGNTALWAKVDYDGGMRPLFLNRYFYIPQGETEFKVY